MHAQIYSKLFVKCDLIFGKGRTEQSNVVNNEPELSVYQLHVVQCTCVWLLVLSEHGSTYTIHHNSVFNITHFQNLLCLWCLEHFVSGKKVRNAHLIVLVLMLDLNPWLPVFV